MQIKLFVYSCICLSGFIMTACSKAPKGILSEKKMRDVEVDMHLAQEMTAIDHKNITDNVHREALYRSVFEKHGITQALYDSSLVWYGRNLDIYMKVCDKVVAILNERQKALGDVQAAAVSDVKSDSVDIWPRMNEIQISPHSVFTGTTFKVEPEQNYSSGSAFIFNADVWGINHSMTYYPNVSITADQGDTLITVSSQMLRDGKFDLKLHTIPTKKVKRVYGYIFLNNADSTSYHKIYLKNISLIRLNYGRINKTPDSMTMQKEVVK